MLFTEEDVTVLLNETPGLTEPAEAPDATVVVVA
jgi:hypothetical protein